MTRTATLAAVVWLAGCGRGPVAEPPADEQPVVAVMPVVAAPPAEPVRFAERKEVWQKRLDQQLGLPINGNRERGVLGCVRSVPGECKVHLIYDPAVWWYTLDFVRGGKTLVTHMGHDRTHFEVVKDVLYFADFPTSTTGCTVTAHDLRTGAKLWGKTVNPFGSIQHSAYSNEVFLVVHEKDDTDPDEVVQVIGREAYGDYIEVLDRKTGVSLAYKAFRTGFAPRK